MTRVFYAYCTKPDAPARIAALERELGWTPAMVITCAARHAEIAKRYPDAPVYMRDEFFTRVGPRRESAAASPHLVEDVEYFRPHALTALSMMERFAHPDEFTFRERRRYLRELIREWGAVLDELAPDVVHFDETPHGAMYFVIYHLAKRRGIPTVWFAATGFTGYNFLGESIAEMPIRRAPVGTLDESVDVDAAMGVLRARIETLRGDGGPRHWYMEAQREYTQSLESAGRSDAAAREGVARKLLRISQWPHYARTALSIPNARAAAHAAAQARELWLDGPNEQMQFFYFPPTSDRVAINREYLAALDRRQEFKEALAGEYSRRASSQPLDCPYVYFPLHFQPERTTNPEGGVFEDQLIAVSAIHDALPDGWLLYVKEHPTQFNPNPVLASEKGRSAVDYDDLLRHPNVRLISMDVPTSELTLGSRATVTVTGTAAWEAAANGVPGIHLAHTWYEGFPGTVHLPNGAALADFFARIYEYVPTSPDAEDRYLWDFLAGAFSFDICEQDLPEGSVTSEHQEAGAISALAWWDSRRPSEANATAPSGGTD
jgi:hypothetical protein